MKKCSKLGAWLKSLTRRKCPMDLLALLNALVANIADLQSKLADTQAAAEALAKAKYDEGFAAGAASVVPGPDTTPFSQADLDAAVASALAPVQAELQAVKDSIQPAIDAAVAAIKADLKTKVDALLA